MGLSLSGLGKSLQDILGGVGGGIEHLIGGAGQAIGNEVGQLPQQVNNAVSDVNHLFAPRPTTNVSLPPPPPAAPNFVENLLNGALNPEQALASRGAATTLGPTLLSGVQGFTRSVPQVGLSLVAPNKTYTPGSKAEKLIFGNTPVQSIEAGVGSTYANHPNLPAPLRVGLAGAYGAGQVLQDLPLVSGAAKAAKAGAEALDVGGAIDKANTALGERGSVPLPGKKPAGSGLVDSQVKYTTPTDVQGTGNLKDDLIQNFRQLTGSAKANSNLAEKIVSESQGNPDLEAVYHHAEDPTVPLTPAQQEIFDTQVKPLQLAQQEQAKGLAQAKGETFTPNDGPYVHRIVQGKNSNLEKYYREERQNPTAGATRVSVDSGKGRVYGTATDEEGNRTLIATHTPKDELGKSTGSKRIVAIKSDGTSEDLGAVKIKTKDELMKQDIRPAQKKLNGLQSQYRALERVKSRGGDTTAQQNALARKVAAIRDSAESAGRDLTKPEARSVRLAISKGKVLSKVTEPSNNVIRLKENLGTTIINLKRRIADIGNKYDESSLKGKVFTDKTGKRYTLGEATTKEIEETTKASKTPTTYYHNPVGNSAINLAETANARNSAEFKNWFKTHPDLDKISSPADKTPPKGWVRAESPYFEGRYFPKNIAKELNDISGGAVKEPGLFGKFWRGFNTSVIKTIMASPLIHGTNQEVNALFQAAWRMPGWSIANMAKIASRQIAMSDEEFGKYAQRFYRAGGDSPDYGANRYGFIAKGLQAAHIDPAIAELSPRAMAAIEEHIRVATFKTAVENGMDDFKAVKLIDQTLGGPDMVSDLTSIVGIFVHYLKMNTKLVGSIGVQTLKGNIRPLLGAGVAYASYLAANKAFQAATGNPNAKLHAPGFVGTGIQLAEAPGQLASGQVPTVVTSHINPAIQAALEEGLNRNLQQPLFGPGASRNSLTSAGNTTGGRLGVAESTLFGPGQQTQKVASGKMSIPEALMDITTAARTPHAAGAPAAPSLPLLNTPGTKPVADETVITPQGTKTISDPTGYQQQKQYYKALDQIDAGLSATDKMAADNFLMKDKTPAGQTIELNQGQSESNWKSLATNSGALQAVQKFYQASGNHNPQWDLTGDGTINGQSVPKLQLYATYKSLPPGDLQKDAIAQENPWINKTENDVATWGQQQTFSGNTVQGAGFVPPPTQTPAVQQMMNTVTQLSSIPSADRTVDQIKQLSTLEQNPDLQQAFTDIQTYTNAVRKQMNLPEIKYAGNTPPAVQNWTNAYMAASSAQRKDLRTAYPQMYNQMQAGREQEQLSALEKQGGEGYYGANLPDSFLGNIYGLGNYDITKGTNPNGSSAYALTDFTGSTPASNGLPMMTTAAAKAAGATTGGGSGGSGYAAGYAKAKSFAAASSNARKIRMAGKASEKRAHKVYMNEKNKLNLGSARLRVAKVKAPYYPETGQKNFKRSRPKVSIKRAS